MLRYIFDIRKEPLYNPQVINKCEWIITQRKRQKSLQTATGSSKLLKKMDMRHRNRTDKKY